MSVTRIAALFCLAVLCAAGPAAAQSSGNVGASLPDESMLNRRGLTRRWWGHATVNSSRDRLLFLTADEGHLFAQSSSGTVTAFDSETGKLLWSRAVGPRDRAVYPASFNDDLLFIVNGLTMYGIRKTNGDIAWELNLPGQPASGASSDDRRIYVGFLDGSLYAFELKKIRELYADGLIPQWTHEAVAWRYRTSYPITVPAVPVGKVVAFATKGGMLYSVGAVDHNPVFQFETDAPLTAPVVRYRNDLILASEDSNLYSLNSANGRQNWEFTVGSVIRRAPVLIDEEVYLFPEGGRMFKLSADSGKELWRRPQQQVDSFLSASAQRVYVVDRRNNLRIVNRSTGETEGDLPLRKFTVLNANDHSDRIFGGTETGLIVCVHELGRDFPRYHQHPERQPLLPEFAKEGEAAEEAGNPPETPAEGENDSGDADAK